MLLSSSISLHLTAARSPYSCRLNSVRSRPRLPSFDVVTANRLDLRHFIGKYISVRICEYYGIACIQAFDAGKMSAVIMSGNDHVL